MKHLCLNLKRFDVPAAVGGVNRLAAGSEWAPAIVNAVKEALEAYRGEARFPVIRQHRLPQKPQPVRLRLLSPGAGAQTQPHEQRRQGQNHSFQNRTPPSAPQYTQGEVWILSQAAGK